MKKALLVACLASLGVPAVGCSKDSCVDMCEQQSECSETDADCEEVCKEARSDAEAAGCTDTQEKLFECAAEIDDFCETGLLPTCTDQATAHLSCFEQFCGSNPDSAPCTK